MAALVNNAGRVKNYVENSDDEEAGDAEPANSSEDESFDEDDDPDKIEVPGGGSTLQDSLKFGITGMPDLIKTDPGGPVTSTQMLSNMSTVSQFPTASAAVLAARNHGVLPGQNATAGGGRAGYTVPDGTSVRPSVTRAVPGAHRIFDPGALVSQALRQPPVATDFSALTSLQNLNQLLGLSGDLGDGLSMNNISGSSSFFQLYSALLDMNNSYNSLGQHLNSTVGPGMNDMNLLRRGVPMAQYSDVLYGNRPMAVPKPMVKPEPEEDDGQEDEVLGVAETYADYIPAKLKYGKPHPDPIVETASLSSVQPPEVYYKLHLPSKVIDKGFLSALQLEAVVYSCQQHEHFLQSNERAGFLIGDGAGVGKGRTIAGIIYENYLCGRKKALWVSISADLKEDAERDLRDIGADIPVTALNKLKYGKISIKEGVLFSTYSGLIGESNTGGKFNTRLKQIIDWLGTNFEGLVVFDECHRAKNLCPSGASKPTKTATTVFKLQADLKRARIVYASATGASEPRHMAYMSRLGIWGPGTPFKGFQDFINAVEKRGIGAMEIVAMDMKLRGAYIARQLSFQGVAFSIEEVPLKDEFEKMYDEAVELWVEAMQKFIEAAELMKADKTAKKSMWAQFWSSHQRFFKYLCIASKVERAVCIASEALKDGKCVVIGLQSTGEARTAEQKEREGELDDFVSTAKGVFQSLIEKHFPAPDRNKIRRLLGISMIDSLFDKPVEEPQPGSSSSSKGKPVRKAAQNAAKRGRWHDSDHSDNENDSDFSNANGSESDEEVSTDSKASDSEFESVSSEAESDEGGATKGKKRTAKQRKKVTNQPKESKDVPSKEAVDRACQMRDDLLKKIENLGAKLPNNTLDQLIDELGGPNDVAEMTGRKMRLIQVESGRIEYQSRAESDISLDQINLTEKQRFMDGDKCVAIISEAASSGISLQSDRRAKNRKRRVHITLELPWSADRAIQQFGRTHRSNQVNAPEYVFLISDLAGEHRFASIVAKRLESLGALTHGDRRATDTRDLSRFHIDSRFGKSALECCSRYIVYGSTNGLPVPPPHDYKGDFRRDVASGLIGVGLIVSSDDPPGVPTADKDFSNMSKFLNRILGMPVSLQNALFKFFTDILAALITNAKRQGRFDMGILNLDNNNGKTSLAKTQRFARKHATGSGLIELHQVVVERGMSWEESQVKYKELTGKNEGYYLSKEAKNDKHVAVLIVRDDCPVLSKKDKTPVERYSVYRPSTGLQARRDTVKEVLSKYKKVTPEEAEKPWNDQHEHSRKTCVHAFWSGRCRNAIVNPEVECDVGRRTRTYCVLSGSVLLCWDEVEDILSRRNSHKIQIVRVVTGDGHKFVGLLIPTSSVRELTEVLRLAEEREKMMTHELKPQSQLNPTMKKEEVEYYDVDDDSD